MTDSDDLEAATGPWSQLPQRLRRTMMGLTLDEVARASGVARRNLSRYLSGQLPKLPEVIAIADACGVSVEWLATGRGKFESGPGALIDPPPNEATSPSQFVSGSGKSRYVALPRYNIAASAGSGALAEHNQVVEYIAFDIDFIRNRLRRDPKHLVLIEARGDSMEPTIRDGDILTIDVTPNQPLQSSTLYVIRVEDALMVKRLDRRTDGAIIVHSDNSRYPPETVPRELRDTLHVIGQVLLVSAPPR